MGMVNQISSSVRPEPASRVSATTKENRDVWDPAKGIDVNTRVLSPQITKSVENLKKLVMEESKNVIRKFSRNHLPSFQRLNIFTKVKEKHQQR